MKVSIISSQRPAVLSKQIARGADGALVKTSSAHLSLGHVQVAEVGSMSELARLLDGLMPNQAVAYGAPTQDNATLCSRAQLPNHPGAITRSDDHFRWPKSDGVMVLDYDAPTGAPALSQSQLLQAVFSLAGGAAAGGWCWRPSASGNIYDAATGEELVGLKGQRVYLRVTDPADILRAGQALHARMWLAGYGRIEIAQNGAQLERSLIDTAMWQPSRLDFAAGAVCGAGLVRCPPAAVWNDGPAIDLKACIPPLTSDEQAAYRRRVADAKSATSRESAEQFERHVHTVAAEEGVSADEVRARYTVAMEKRVLCNDFVIQLAYGEGEVTVRDILLEPQAWHGKICLDPVEPEYNNRHPVGKIFVDERGAYLDSKAHGGAVYRLGSIAALAFQSGASTGTTFRDLMDDIRLRGCDLAAVGELANSVNTGPFSDEERALLRAELAGSVKDAKRLTPEVKAIIYAGAVVAEPGKVATFPSVAAAPPALCLFSQLAPKPLSRASGDHYGNAELLVREVFGPRLTGDRGLFRWWSGCEWRAVEEQEMQYMVAACLGMSGRGKSGDIDGTIKVLRHYLGRHSPPDCPRDCRVYWSNGVLDVATGVFSPHAPENGNRGALPFAFDPAVAGVAPWVWLGFLESLWGGFDDYHDRVALLQEIMGWAMMRSDLNIQKIIAMDGSSRAGKGVILDVLRGILGDGVCGTFEFSDIADGKTQSAFRHYDVMIDSEAKAPPRQALKKAIGFMNKMTSNETVSIQLLNTQTPWAGKLDCKAIIACNGIPTMTDDYGATTNRFHVLRFDRSFEGREDRTLGARLVPEYQQIAMWALYGAGRLVANGGRFTDPESSRCSREHMREANEPMQDFIAEYLEFDPEARTPAKDIWRAYQQYLAETNGRPCGRNTFYSSLRASLTGHPATWIKQMRIAGENPVPCVAGVKVKTAALAAFGK